jgi:hypothetical protein
MHCGLYQHWPAVLPTPPSLWQVEVPSAAATGGGGGIAQLAAGTNHALARSETGVVTAWADERGDANLALPAEVMLPADVASCLTTSLCCQQL